MTVLKLGLLISLTMFFISRVIDSGGRAEDWPAAVPVYAGVLRTMTSTPKWDSISLMILLTVGCVSQAVLLQNLWNHS